MCLLGIYLRGVGGLLLSLGLGSCLLGPDFNPQPAPVVKRYTYKLEPSKTVAVPNDPVGSSQHFLFSCDIPGQWWNLFHSRKLDNLIYQGLLHSPTLEIAKANLKQAQENLRAEVGTGLFPLLNVTGGMQRISPSKVGFSNPNLSSSTNSTSSLMTQNLPNGQVTDNIFNLYNGSLNISYSLDVFGSIRRQIESLNAQVEYQYLEWQAAYLTLTANIVTTSFLLASLLKQIEATQQLIKNEQLQLNILKAQFHLGGVDKLTVLTQEALVNQTKASLPPLKKNLAIARDALAVYTGIFPSQAELPNFDLYNFTLPQQIPISLPSLLVQQRPDVRASEALLHSAGAQIGVATANLFPQFNLTGSYGSLGNTINNLFQYSNVTWSLTGQIAQTLFKGGALLAQRRAAIAAYDGALAQYKQTVLQAFQNVADVLSALDEDARTLKSQKAALVASRESFNLSRQQFKLGGINYLVLLTAEQQYQQAQIQLIQAQTSRFTDTAALFQALGGGWWNQNCIALSTTKK